MQSKVLKVKTKSNPEYQIYLSISNIMVLKKPVQLREKSTNGTEQYCVKILGVNICLWRTLPSNKIILSYISKSWSHRVFLERLIVMLFHVSRGMGHLCVKQTLVSPKTCPSLSSNLPKKLFFFLKLHWVVAPHNLHTPSTLHLWKGTNTFKLFLITNTNCVFFQWMKGFCSEHIDIRVYTASKQLIPTVSLPHWVHPFYFNKLTNFLH